jgi:hypothetical protein
VTVSVTAWEGATVNGESEDEGDDGTLHFCGFVNGVLKVLEMNVSFCFCFCRERIK